MVSDYLTSLAGGVLIGLAAILLMLFNGRIAGISGIVSGALWSNTAKGSNTQKGSQAKKAQFGVIRWQWYFLGGILLSGLLMVTPLESMFNVMPVEPASFAISLPVLLLSGLLVGLGCCLGNGCTSGHGVCGMGRLSFRSIVATLLFMLVAFVVASLLH
ncbi:YeeE/YedE family protein [Shewanella sp. AS1]|uniref:YeeE/YedE family protein n=1 Tax=Shewanella sp. AS1 TaxID=2907626 RepID=UPI001F400D84|nr:YeeE/YedE thiosulfate transporter family protein [Shewanella sp. AS1]MCE9677730.1 YeeE/YedE family protein [Shewanella sp. AS1]